MSRPKNSKEFRESLCSSIHSSFKREGTALETRLVI